MSEVTYTPEFEAAISRCRSAGSDTGHRVEYYRYRGGLRKRIKRVEKALTKSESYRALRRLSSVSNLHTVPCRGEVCAGDDIVFVDRDISYSPGRYGSPGYRTENITPRVARVVSVSIGNCPDQMFVVLETEAGETTKELSILGDLGIWRQPWGNEYARDGSLAVLMLQQETATNDFLRCGLF